MSVSANDTISPVLVFVLLVITDHVQKVELLCMSSYQQRFSPNYVRILIFRFALYKQVSMCTISSGMFKNHGNKIIYSCCSTLARFVCLFVCLKFFVPLDNFHSFGNITITGEGLQVLTHACSALMAIKQ